MISGEISAEKAGGIYMSQQSAAVKLKDIPEGWTSKNVGPEVIAKLGYQFVCEAAAAALVDPENNNPEAGQKAERFEAYLRSQKNEILAHFEEKCRQLQRKRKLIMVQNALIEPYAHTHPSWKEDKVGEALYDNNACLFYVYYMICIRPWMDRRQSTSDTVFQLNVLLDYLGKSVDLIADITRRRTEMPSHGLKKITSRVLPWGEMPFIQRKEYGNLYFTFPPYKDIKGPIALGDVEIKRIVKHDIFGEREGDTLGAGYDCNLKPLTEKERRDRAMFLMLYFELHGSMRLRYVREIERIKSSVHLRYSQYKAQVMINKASDKQRTRLTHSLQVESIAKVLAQQLGCNWELAQAIALGHDLGHVPFGHTGETALDECLHKAFAGRFLHALQGVKVLNNLENHSTIFDHYGITGQVLSRRILEGILKHDTDCLLQDLRRAAWRLQYDGWKEALPKGFDMSKEEGTRLQGPAKQQTRYKDDEWGEAFISAEWKRKSCIGQTKLPIPDTIGRKWFPLGF